MKHPRLKIIAPFVLFVAFALYVLVTQRMMIPDASRGGLPSHEAMFYFQSAATILLLICITAVACIYYLWVAVSSISETAKNILLSVFVLIIALLGAECFFLHYAKSNAIGDRWSYKLWDKKYMTHRTYFYFKNSKGQDDQADFREPVTGLKCGKKKIWFIGDSFTFGFGIEQTAKTFPVLTSKLLNDQVCCVNLGTGGADTYFEKEILYAYHHAGNELPYAVVWQYFGNDIDSADIGPDIYDKEYSKTAWDNFGRTFFRAKSFLLDYIYWEYFMGNERGTKNVYIDFLEQAYTADSIVVNGRVLKDSLGNISPFRKHLFPLKEAAAYCQSKGVKFLVVIFPYLWKDGPENAERLYGHRLEKELKADNTDVIDLSPLVKDLPVKDREVNSHDLHPSPMVDQIVADTIAKYMRSKYGL